MTKHLTIKNHHYEKKRFYTRLVFVGILIGILTAILIIRLIYLQIDKNKLYTALSEKNQLSVLPIEPRRGLIYDRNGILIADNIPIFNLSITPEKIFNMEKTIKNLQLYIDITEEDKKRFYQQVEQRRRFDKIPLRYKLTEEEVARFYVNQYQFPGVSVETQFIRSYPFSELDVDVLGYVGRINRYDYRYLHDPNYLATQYVGKIGIEKNYEDILHGAAGYQQVETDVNGRIVRTVKHHSATPGANLYLTIDNHLQKAAHEALLPYRGAVVAINPNNGEVLVLASNPHYDPNLFVQGMSQEKYQELQNDKQQPLFNRALRGQYAMASTIKPFLALGALELGITTAEHKINDTGIFKLNNSQHKYRDWKRGGHGWVDLSRAIMVSCNTYFYELALHLGINNMNKILRQFGFGSASGIDVNEELPGLIPTPEWKLGYHGKRWYVGDTVLSGIGQGFILTTPLQLAVATTGIANQGIIYKPHLLKQIETNETSSDPETLSEITIQPENWKIVIDAMKNVIGNPSGTGFRFGRTKYTIAGKTGTAQLERKSENAEVRHKDNSIFIAFAPIENPKIAIAVVVESSPDAPRVARQVLDAFFENNQELT